MRSKGRRIVAYIFAGLLVVSQMPTSAQQVEILGTNPNNGKTMIAVASKDLREFNVLVPPFEEPNHYHTVILYTDTLNIDTNGHSTFETTTRPASSWGPNLTFICKQISRRLEGPAEWNYRWLGFSQPAADRCLTGDHINPDNIDALAAALPIFSQHHLDSQMFFTKATDNEHFTIRIQHRIADESDIRMGYKYIYRFHISVPLLIEVSGDSKFFKIDGSSVSIEFPPLDTNKYEVIINGTINPENSRRGRFE